MGDHPYGDYGNSPNSLVLTYYTHVCECCQTLCYREVTYEHMLQVVVSRMTNYTSFVTALRFFFLSVMWVTPDSCFPGVRRESKKHI